MNEKYEKYEKILITAYSDLELSLESESVIPSFDWFCELVQDENHLLYKHFVEPVYKQELRKEKIKRLKNGKSF